MSKELALKIEHVSKQYRLGQIGGGTLQGDLQSWWARMRGKEDPNTKIGSKQHVRNERFWALDDINLEVKKGEAVGIIGHNGAGKSTLLKLLSRVTAPTKGEISINGRIASMLEVGTGFHGEMTGRENIYMNGAILGMTKEEIDKKIDRIIDFSECRQFIDTPVKRYSSGMYVKLAFAVAAHLDSEIMVMDEVLAVGDMKFQQKALGRMGEAAGEEGRTVLYVSHNMATIRQLCTRCVVLDHGHVIFDGDVEEAIAIYSDVNQAATEAYFDFDKIHRDKPELAQNAKLKDLKLIEKSKWIYEKGEHLKFNLRIANTKDYRQRFRLAIPIKYIDSSPIGTYFSDIILCDANTLYDGCFDIDISMLPEGKYQFVVALYAVNEFGAEAMCDHSIINIGFIINDNSESHIEWKHKWWGHIAFK